MDIGLSWYIRTPIGKKRGIWASKPSEDLIALLLQEAASRFTLADEIILASAITSGGNAARYAALAAGLPTSIPAYLLDAQCLGSAQALALGWAKLKSGLAQTVWIGGMESASLPATRGFHPLDPRYIPEKPTYQTALFTPSDSHQPMAIQMEPLMKNYSRDELDDWGILSKQKAWQAQSENLLDDLIFPKLPDELIQDPALDQILRTRWFSRYPDQNLHPWNCAQEADAAALIGLSTQPSDMIIRHVVTVGYSPKLAALSCVEAVEQVFKQTEWHPNDIDLWEIHEAFSMKPVSISHKWSVNPSKVNIFGGNLAYGHPFGASGAVGIMHLAEGLRHRKKRLGIFTMSAAGGMGIAILLERKN